MKSSMPIMPWKRLNTARSFYRMCAMDASEQRDKLKKPGCPGWFYRQKSSYIIGIIDGEKLKNRRHENKKKNSLLDTYGIDVSFSDASRRMFWEKRR